MTRETSGSFDSRSAVAPRPRARRQHAGSHSRRSDRVAQVEEGRDRLHLRAAQVDRIEVELQVDRAAAAAERDDRASPTMIGDAVTLHETVDRRQRREAERLGFARRIEHLEQRRQQRDAGAGMRSACPCRRSGRARTRRDSRSAGTTGSRPRSRRPASVSGAPHCAGVRQQRLVQIVDLVAVGAIAHAVLDAEIDAEADEQHRERDRDQVERPDHQQAERRRDREPDDQVDEHREDDPRPTSARATG